MLLVSQIAPGNTQSAPVALLSTQIFSSMQPRRGPHRLLMCGGYVNRVTAEPAYVTDQVFAPLDQDHRVERVGGGFETEVYCLENRHYLVKLKSELGSDLPGALAYARQMRSIAEQFARCLGPDYSVHSDYI